MSTECDNSRVLPDLILDIDADDTLPSNETFHVQVFPSTSKSSKSTSESQINKYNMNVNNEEQKTVKTDSRTPRRSQGNNSRGNSKSKQTPTQSNTRQYQQHSFLTDITEVRQMEQGLLKLLDDFHSGKLQAFGKDCTFEKMEQVREQQERLARLHFELNAQQEMYGPQSEGGRRMGRENLGKLIENLQQLSHSIEQLQISSPSIQTDV